MKELSTRKLSNIVKKSMKAQKGQWFLSVPELYHMKNRAVSLSETWQKKRNTLKSPNTQKKDIFLSFILMFSYYTGLSDENIPSAPIFAAVTQQTF